MRSQSSLAYRSRRWGRHLLAVVLVSLPIASNAEDGSSREAGHAFPFSFSGMKPFGHPQHVQPRPSSKVNRTPKATPSTVKQKWPDLVPENLQVNVSRGGLGYELTVKNIGDGTAHCVKLYVLDSRRIKKHLQRDLCSERSGQRDLEPGQEMVLRGAIYEPPPTASVDKIWKWPGEQGYMSKIRFYVSADRDRDVKNNATGFMTIYWDWHKAFPSTQ